jgi:hypothetical protein
VSKLAVWWLRLGIQLERIKPGLVARLLEGEKMAPLCAEFGISRKIGEPVSVSRPTCSVTTATTATRQPATPFLRAEALVRESEADYETGVTARMNDDCAEQRRTSK